MLGAPAAPAARRCLSRRLTPSEPAAPPQMADRRQQPAHTCSGPGCGKPVTSKAPWFARTAAGYRDRHFCGRVCARAAASADAALAPRITCTERLCDGLLCGTQLPVWRTQAAGHCARCSAAEAAAADDVQGAPGRLEFERCKPPGPSAAPA